MSAELLEVLDECLEQIDNGETVESCLAEYPLLWEQLEPLLTTALSLSSLPEVLPSDEFRRSSKARLLARISQQPVRAKSAKTPRLTLLHELTTSWQRMWRTVLGAKRVAIPVTLALFLLLGVSLSGVSSHLFSTPALASQCTLSVLSGSVEVQKPGHDESQPGTDGMTLTVGTRIKTAPGSHALLTFFEGSTAKIEPDSDVEIQQVDFADGRTTGIVLKQWLGRTWSRVVKMADPGSQYQIETPSATAIVRGTLFLTEVEDNGLTRVSTVEGLVSVVAEGGEVQVSANEQAQVAAGAAPSQPAAIPSPKFRLLVTVTAPAVGAVTDPTGSSTGNLPSGFSFNQISGSQSSLPSTDTQLISITEPVAGEYIISLRYLVEGTASFMIQGESEGKTLFTYIGTWGAEKNSGWLIHLNLNVKDGQIVGSEISSIERLGKGSPEEVVEIPTEKAVPTAIVAEESAPSEDLAGAGVQGSDAGIASIADTDDIGEVSGSDKGASVVKHVPEENGQTDAGGTQDGGQGSTGGEDTSGGDAAQGTPSDQGKGSGESPPGDKDTPPGHQDSPPGDKDTPPGDHGKGNDQSPPGNGDDNQDKDKNKNKDKDTGNGNDAPDY